MPELPVSHENPAGPQALPRCSVFIAVSVDGQIARPNGAIDWLSLVAQPGEDYGYRAFADSVDTVVMGRATYDTALGFDDWPHAGKRCVVMTHRAPEPRQGERFFEGKPADLLARLSLEGARHVYVDGGAVIRQFLEANLVDELTLSVVPVVLGAGIALFDDQGPERQLELESVRSFSGGLVQLRYRVRR